MLFTKRIEIDPVRDNLTNRISTGTVMRGALTSSGGLLIQGHLVGEPLVVKEGPLLVHESGVLQGNVIVHGDCYIFGTAGSPDSEDGSLNLEVRGVLHLASTCRTFGSIVCSDLATYNGCSVNSKIKTAITSYNPEPDIATSARAAA